VDEVGGVTFIVSTVYTVIVASLHLRGGGSLSSLLATIKPIGATGLLDVV